MNVALLLTGNELMSGDTVDSNSAMIAQKFALGGFQVAKKVTVGDDLAQLVEELKNLASGYSIVLVNGGLGPTVDDLTAEALAMLLEQPLVENDEALAHLQNWCEARTIALNAANLKQAILPKGAAVIANRRGGAVGFHAKYRGCLIACTPGVPSELETMLDEQILPLLEREYPDATAKFIRRLKVFGVGESRLQQLIVDAVPDWPQAVELGFRAGLPTLELKLAVNDRLQLPERDACEAKIRQLIGDYIVGENDDGLAQIVVESLQRENKKVALAESCTGGRIASELTSIAGASTIFELGVVSYSNTVKHNVLAVPTDVLTQYGAVSEQVVRAMALGVLHRSQADIAVAVSGVAGPDGGSEEKPVGTVWLAWGARENLRTAKFFLPVKRSMFQTLVAAIGLDLVRRYLKGEYAVPQYFGRN